MDHLEMTESYAPDCAPLCVLMTSNLAEVELTRTDASFQIFAYLLMVQKEKTALYVHPCAQLLVTAKRSLVRQALMQMDARSRIHV